MFAAGKRDDVPVRLRFNVERLESVNCLQVREILSELFHGGKIDMRKLERQTTAAEIGDWPTAQKGSGVKVTGRDCESVSGCLRGGPWGDYARRPTLGPLIPFALSAFR